VNKTFTASVRERKRPLYYNIFINKCQVVRNTSRTCLLVVSNVMFRNVPYCSVVRAGKSLINKECSIVRKKGEN